MSKMKVLSNEPILVDDLPLRKEEVTVDYKMLVIELEPTLDTKEQE